MPAGLELRLLLPEPAIVHWGRNGWHDKSDTASEDWGLGHVARLQTAGFAPGDSVDFTFYWPSRDAWQGKDFSVAVTKRALP